MRMLMLPVLPPAGGFYENLSIWLALDAQVSVQGAEPHQLVIVHRHSRNDADWKLKTVNSEVHGDSLLPHIAMEA